MTPEPSSRCPRCGWPDADPYEIVSRHTTSAGVIVYSRCACGRLQVRRDGELVVRSGGPGPALARGRC